MNEEREQKLSNGSSLYLATEKTMKIIQDKIGFLKVNLYDSDNDAEGVWVAPCTEEDAKKMRDNKSHDEMCDCYLANSPLGWGTWGLKVKVRTQGHNRPAVKIEDQSFYSQT